MASLSRKLITGFSLALLCFTTLSLPTISHASTPSTPTYKFEFDGNFTPTIGSATFGPSTACPAWSCITSGIFGTSSGDGYWQWAGASGNGPGLSLGSYSMSDTYTITIKFSVSYLTGYSRILNFNEGDIGLYLLSGHIDYYNYVSSTSPIYAANDIITMTLTRNPQYITLYTSDSTTSTTTQRFQYASGSIARVSPLSTLPFFTDDGGEFSPSGKVFSVSIWNDRALTSTEINSYLYTPLVPSFQFSNSVSSAVYRSVQALDMTMNLPGKSTYLVNGKKISGCSSISNSGSSGSYTSRCNWKPSLHGINLVKVVFTPTDTSFSPMIVSRNYIVSSRSGTR